MIIIDETLYAMSQRKWSLDFVINTKRINFAAKNMSDKFQNKYRILSTRAAWHDYNGGAYFITICTRKHKHLFGEIVSGTASTEATMHFTEIGKHADKLLREITQHNPYCEIPLHVVMPNHLHAIVFIDGDAYCRDAVFNVSMETVTGETGSSVRNEKMVEIAKRQSLLTVSMRGFKSAITRFANENSVSFAWHVSFHDHIIRNQSEMNYIANYIENNVAKWDMDCYNELSGKTPPPI